MILHVKDTKYLHDYLLWLRFNDGAEGVADLKEELYGKVFEPLKDIERFKSCNVDPDLETIVRDNGTDLSSACLYEKMKVLA